MPGGESWDKMAGRRPIGTAHSHEHTVCSVTGIWGEVGVRLLRGRHWWQLAPDPPWLFCMSELACERSAVIS